MAISAVSPTAQKPLHHITLTDGTTIIGLVAVKQSVDKNGEIVTTPDENVINVTPANPLAIQTSQGNSEYSDREWPYLTMIQDDWSGGRGGETFEDDKSRFYDSKRVNTWRGGELLLGPLETYSEINEIEQYMPGDTSGSGVTWSDLYGSTRYWSTTWTQDGTWTADDSVEVFVRKIGSPGTFTIRFAVNDGGDPDAASVATGTDTGATLNANESCFLRIGLTAAYEFQDTHVYHIEAYGADTDDSDDHWEIGTATGTTGGQKSADQLTYTSSQLTIYYRIVESYTSITKLQTGWVFGEYKGALYAYSQPPTGNSILWINGDRGVADSNTGALTTLVDAAKAWTVDEWIGSVVKITAGPGSEEVQPWRNITDSSATTLTVSPAWNTEHTTSTEYVITESNKWNLIGDLAGFVTDHAITSDYIYFARGETASKNILSGEWYNNAGTATFHTNIENMEAKHLLAIHHPEDERDTLYIGVNQHSQYGVAVGKMQVPGTWGDLILPMGQLAYTNTPWADRSITNCTQITEDQATKITITNTFTTGLCAVQNLPQPVDITKANQLGLWIKSSVAFASGGSDDISLEYEDFKDTGGYTNYLVKVATPVAVTQWDDTSHTTLWKVIDGEPSTEDSVTGFTTTHAFYVVGDYKYDKIVFDIGATPNAVESVLSADYFNGKEFTSLTIVDGTDGTTEAIITNGTFDADSDWTKGTGWTIPTPTADCDGSQVAASELKQTGILVDGGTYVIKFTVSDYTAGNVTLYMGSGTAGTARSANGTYTETLACAGSTDLILQGDADFDGKIDDVILVVKTLSTDGSVTFTAPNDWREYQITDDTGDRSAAYSYTGYMVRLTVSVNLTSPITIASISLSRHNQNTINLGALVADEWTYVVADITPEKFPAPDDTQIQSVGLYIEDDQNANFNIMMRGGIDLLYNTPDWKPLPSNDKITGMIEHNGNVQEPRTNPWVFTEGSRIYEMQSQNEDQFIPVTIGEMEALRSENTGAASCVNDVYLYFSLGEERIERWFNNSLDDVGPDGDFYYG